MNSINIKHEKCVIHDFFDSLHLNLIKYPEWKVSYRRKDANVGANSRCLGRWGHNFSNCQVYMAKS